MSLNLMTVFKTSDLQKFGQTASNVVSLAFKTNKKNGSKIAKDSVSWLYFGSNNLVREKYQIKFREYE